MPLSSDRVSHLGPPSEAPLAEITYPSTGDTQGEVPLTTSTVTSNRAGFASNNPYRMNPKSVEESYESLTGISLGLPSANLGAGTDDVTPSPGRCVVPTSEASDSTSTNSAGTFGERLRIQTDGVVFTPPESDPGLDPVGNEDEH